MNNLRLVDISLVRNPPPGCELSTSYVCNSQPGKTVELYSDVLGVPHEEPAKFTPMTLPIARAIHRNMVMENELLKYRVAHAPGFTCISPAAIRLMEDLIELEAEEKL